jgi:Protein of unknown function (DUF3017)
MTPDTQQARAGHRRPQGKRRDAGTAIRSVPLAAEAARTGYPGAAARPAGAFSREPAATVTSRQGDAGYPPGSGQAGTSGQAGQAGPSGHAAEDASIVMVVPLLAVLVVAVASVYMAWRQGSAGGRDGGVVAGCALFAAATFRLLLPDRLAGLLSVRSRATDVCALVAFGVGLLVVGLALPR